MAALSNTSTLWHWLFDDTYVAGSYNLVDIADYGGAYTLGANALNTDYGSPLNDGAKVVGGHAMDSGFGGAGLWESSTYPPPILLGYGPAVTALMDEFTLDIVFRPTAFTNCHILEASYPFSPSSYNRGVSIKLNSAGRINVDWEYSNRQGVNALFVGYMVLNDWNAVTVVKSRSAGWVLTTNEIYDLTVYHQGIAIQTLTALHNSAPHFSFITPSQGSLGVGGSTYGVYPATVFTGSVDEVRLRAIADTSGNISTYTAGLGTLPAAPAAPPQVYDRSWQFSNDNGYTPANQLDLTRYTCWAIASFMTGSANLGAFASGLWTVVGSSNGVTAGMDATNRLHVPGAYTAGDWLRAGAGVAHSWYVLQSPSMGGVVFQMLVSLGTTVDFQVNFRMSKVGFTGGSTTADPTATDQWTVGGALAQSITYVAGLQRYSCCLSTTGDVIISVYKSGTANKALDPFQLLVLSPVGCHALDGYPLWHNCGSNATTPGANNTYSSGPGTRLGWGLAGVNVIPYSSIALNSATDTDALSGNIPDFPCWVFANAGGAASWHARGRLPDVLWCGTGGSDINMTNGRTIRDGGGVIRYQTFGPFIIPANAAWNLT